MWLLFNVVYLLFLLGCGVTCGGMTWESSLGRCYCVMFCLNVELCLSVVLLVCVVLSLAGGCCVFAVGGVLLASCCVGCCF